MIFGLPHSGFDLALALLAIALAAGLVVGLLCLAYLILTAPMRRAERARLFLELIEQSIHDGRPVEETIISVSQTRERGVGLRFHAVAAWLETGLNLDEALDKVPRFLPPQIRAMMRAGLKMGDLRKVLPACRQLLNDAAANTQSATPYLFMLTFLSAPIGLYLYLKPFPEFRKAIAALDVHVPAASFVLSHGVLWIGAQFGMVFVLMVATFLHARGPVVARWFPVLQRWQYHLPWRRKRMERDFSTILGALLDAGTPEPEAVALAADCTANSIFRRGAARVVAALGEGIKLPEAVAAMDDTGEFAWRLRNAFYGRGKFLRALAGWHEALDAKAYQQQQAASTWITTGLVLWNGLFVAVLIVSVFSFLISLINMGVLW